jgi:NAD(P)-dependent dehydrogenase (short-subunit alcohol dehydrogenase family)
MGWYLTQALVSQGASVLASGRRAGRLRALRWKLLGERARGSILIQTADVLDPSTLDELLGTAIEAWRGLDCLVYTAGIYLPAAFEPSQSKDWSRLFGANFAGFHHLVSAINARVSDRPVHAIAFTSSLAKGGPRESIAYGLTKRLLEDYCQRAGGVLALNRIFLHIVDPGPFRSEMNPTCGVGASEASRRTVARIWKCLADKGSCSACRK